MRALIIDIQLDVCKINYMETDRSTVTCHQFCQIYHFLFCSLAGIWRSMEINSIDLDASLGDHIAGNRTVNTTGKEEHGFTVGSDGHSSRSWKCLGIYIDLVSDLYRKSHLRLMYIYRCLRKSIQDLFSDGSTDFHRSNRIRFFCSSGIYLECTIIIRISVLHISNNVFGHLIKALIFINHYRTDTNNSKYSL